MLPPDAFPELPHGHPLRPIASKLACGVQLTGAEIETAFELIRNQDVFAALIKDLLVHAAKTATQHLVVQLETLEKNPGQSTDPLAIQYVRASLASATSV